MKSRIASRKLVTSWIAKRKKKDSGILVFKLMDNLGGELG